VIKIEGEGNNWTGYFAIYYILMIYGANLAKSGKVSAEVGSLVPVIIMAVAAFTLYRKIKI